MHILDYAIVLCLFLLLLSALVGVCAWLLYRVRRVSDPDYSPDRTDPKHMEVLKIGAAISCLLLFAWLMLQAAFFNFLKKDVAAVLDHYEPAASKVYVNGALSSDGAEIVRLLKHPDGRDTTTIRRQPSYPQEQIDIRILNPQDSIVFTLRRDSRTKNEYWIFYDVYIVTGYSHIGKIWTDVFESEQKVRG